MATGQMTHPEIEEAPDVYRGGKWGVYLRGPDIFFELVDAHRDAFVPLRELAEVRRGITSGCDSFFFVEDVTDEFLEKSGPGLFRATYGITRSQAQRIRIVRAGDGSVHTVERRYLQPEIHSMMEIRSVHVETAELGRMVILCDLPISRLRGTHFLKYVRWGEGEAFSERPTCIARSPWYNLTGARRSPIIFPKIQQYRHIAVWNEGREGSLQVDVYAANMMLVPDLRRGNAELLESLAASVDALGSRDAMNLPDEFTLEDRRNLDDLVLRMIGIDDVDRRTELRGRLYEQISEMYRGIRVAEIEMQHFRARNAQRSKLTPRSIAKTIWEAFDPADIRTFPGDFVASGTGRETVELPDAKRAEVREDLFGNSVVIANGTEIAFKDPLRAAFAARLIDDGVVGSVSIPTEPDVCSDALAEYEDYSGELGRQFEEAAAEITSKLDWQEKTVAELWKLYRAARHKAVAGS